MRNNRKKTLTKKEYTLYHYKDSVKIEGVHSDISGNVNGIRGVVSNIRGDVNDIWGDVSDISGNVTGIYGNLDDCEITDEERERGIDIRELIK